MDQQNMQQKFPKQWNEIEKMDKEMATKKRKMVEEIMKEMVEKDEKIAEKDAENAVLIKKNLALKIKMARMEADLKKILENQVKNIEEDTIKENDPVVNNTDVTNDKKEYVNILDKADNEVEENKAEARFDPNLEKENEPIADEQEMDTDNTLVENKLPKERMDGEEEEGENAKATSDQELLCKMDDDNTLVENKLPNEQDEEEEGENSKATSDAVVGETTNVKEEFYSNLLEKGNKEESFLNSVSHEKGDETVADELCSKPLIFDGCEITVSGFSGSERIDIGRLVEMHGGAFTGQMSKVSCTHLITATNAGEKYRRAKEWGTVFVVNHNWLLKSIEKKKRLPESKFAVGDQHHS